MTFETFKNRVTAELIGRLPQGTTITPRRVTKNNNLILDGIVINRDGQILSPTIYLNEYYTACDKEHIPFDDLVADILSAYQNSVPKDVPDIRRLFDFDRIKDNVILRLVNREKNASLLEQTPFVPFCDLAITYLCLVDIHQENDGFISIRNEHLKKWGITPKEMHALAKANTLSKFPAVFQNIADLLPLAPLTDEPFIPRASDLSFPMFVLSNSLRMHGAACLLYDGLLFDIAKKLGGDLIILPSSIHEVLIIPASAATDTDALNHMICEVNATSVAIDEYLSDHVYFYSAETDEVTY